MSFILLKYMDGHAVALGVIVDSGNFNWDNGKFRLSTPDEFIMVWYILGLGKAAFTKARVTDVI